MGRGCDSVSRAVASDTTDPQFKSIHWQILFTLYCRYWRYENKENRSMEWPIVRQTEAEIIFKLDIFFVPIYKHSKNLAGITYLDKNICR